MYMYIYIYIYIYMYIYIYSFTPLCFSGASEISVDVGLKNNSIYAVIRLYHVNVSVQVYIYMYVVII